MLERIVFSGDLPLAREYKIRTVKDALFKEDREFDKKEIFGIIRNIAEVEGIDSRNLEVTDEVYDGSRRLIKFDVRTTSFEATKFKVEEICFTFMVKGEHKQVGGSLDSGIVRVYASQGKPGEYDRGGIVASYVNGEWKLTPGKISPTVTIIK